MKDFPFQYIIKHRKRKMKENVHVMHLSNGVVLLYVELKSPSNENATTNCSD
jgi:hypothetical protein